jgi:positive regulator of sigma E activity
MKKYNLILLKVIGFFIIGIIFNIFFILNPQDIFFLILGFINFFLVGFNYSKYLMEKENDN